MEYTALKTPPMFTYMTIIREKEENDNHQDLF